ncbi:uncharacterized protein LOC144491131, partial [Mustelus asterias]
MMRAAQIQNRINSPQEIRTLRAELQESLRRVLERPAETPELRVTCDRVIRACIQRLGEEGERELGDRELGDLLELSELACRGYRACAPPSPSSPSPRGQGHLYLE